MNPSMAITPGWPGCQILNEIPPPMQEREILNPMKG